jgi:hypothetical protein
VSITVLIESAHVAVLLQVWYRSLTKLMAVCLAVRGPCSQTSAVMSQVMPLLWTPFLAGHSQTFVPSELFTVLLGNELT